MRNIFDVAVIVLGCWTPWIAAAGGYILIRRYRRNHPLPHGKPDLEPDPELNPIGPLIVTDMIDAHPEPNDPLHPGGFFGF